MELATCCLLCLRFPSVRLGFSLVHWNRCPSHLPQCAIGGVRKVPNRESRINILQKNQSSHLVKRYGWQGNELDGKRSLSGLRKETHIATNIATYRTRGGLTAVAAHSDDAGFVVYLRLRGARTVESVRLFTAHAPYSHFLGDFRCLRDWFKRKRGSSAWCPKAVAADWFCNAPPIP